MGFFGRHPGLSAATVYVLALYLGQGACDSICPNGIINITETTGLITYPTSGDYGVNETVCWKFEVPVTYVKMILVFHRVYIEECKYCECDYVQASDDYNSLSSAFRFCGRFSEQYLEHRLYEVGLPLFIILQTTTMYVRFVSDGNVHLKGFNASVIAGSYNEYSVSTTYLNASEGETIEFGTPKYGIENYPYDYHQKWFLIVPEGRQVQLEFEAFELEESKDCKNDYLEIREAYFAFTDEDPRVITGEFGEILTEHLCGTTKPSKMQSKGNMVWVNFKSDDNTTTVYKGFKATFTAGQRKLSGRNPLTLLLLSTLLLIASKNSVF